MDTHLTFSVRVDAMQILSETLPKGCPVASRARNPNCKAEPHELLLPQEVHVSPVMLRLTSAEFRGTKVPTALRKSIGLESQRLHQQSKKVTAIFNKAAE